LFIGDDWAEAHHDVEVQDEHGRRLARRRLPEGVAGIAALHALVADHLGDDEPGTVVVGIETDRGPSPQAPRATPVMRRSWPIWSAPTGSIIGRSPVTVSSPRRSRRWPGRIRT
jgi:hypothetical protein